MESRVLKPTLAIYVGLFLLFLYGPFVVLTYQPYISSVSKKLFKDTRTLERA